MLRSSVSSSSLSRSIGASSLPPQTVQRIQKEVSEFIQLAARSNWFPSEAMARLRLLLDGAKGQPVHLLAVQLDFGRAGLDRHELEGCEPTPPWLQRLWQDCLQSIGQGLRDNGIGIATSADFGRDDNPAHYANDTAHRTVPLGTAYCPGRESDRPYGKFNYDGGYVLLNSQVSQATPGVLGHEVTHVLQQAHGCELPGYLDLHEAFKDVLCDFSENQAGSVSMLDSPGCCAHSQVVVSRQFGPFDHAQLQQRLDGEVDPALEQRLVVAVIERAEQMEQQAADKASAAAPVDLTRSLISRAVSAFAGQAVKQAIDYTSIRLLPDQASPTLRRALHIVAEVLGIAATVGVMLAMGADPVSSAVTASASALARLPLELLGPEALTAFVNVVGELQWGFLLQEVFQDGWVAATLGLMAGLMGRTLARLAGHAVEALLQRCRPETRPAQRQALATSRLVFGNVYPDLNGQLEVLQTWCQRTKQFIARYPGLDVLREKIYAAEPAEAAEAGKDTPGPAPLSSVVVLGELPREPAPGAQHKADADADSESEAESDSENYHTPDNSGDSDNDSGDEASPPATPRH